MILIVKIVGSCVFWSVYCLTCLGLEAASMSLLYSNALERWTAEFFRKVSSLLLTSQLFDPFQIAGRFLDCIIPHFGD